MFEYEIYFNYDNSIFNKQCLALEKNIPNIRKREYFEDVDGTQIQRYDYNGKIIKVINDKSLGIEVHSEIELTQFFN